jgi:hypothetical protein
VTCLETGGDMVFRLTDYSEKAVILTGDTKEHREELKKMGGKWMRRQEGWVFSKKRRVQLEEWIEDNTVLVISAPEEFFSDGESSEWPDSDYEDLESNYTQLMAISCGGRPVGVYKTVCCDDEIWVYDPPRFERIIKDYFSPNGNTGNDYFRITTSAGIATWSKSDGDQYDGDFKYTVGIKIPTTVGPYGEEWEVSRMVCLYSYSFKVFMCNK